MESIGTTVNGALSGIEAELLVVAPAAIGVAALLWGIPKAVRFFKRVAA